ncbi:MAG: GGDEF domain-containing protein [Bdellovibrionales bacterium CG10_big_fil_rev_8_21_14_0_10_45_34]|nr:MAG: GGDEF domain-containing protein [Bdellovibrionales bacterium CG10_big_fil_rev_8_21_14_0_10_45_34]
MSRPKKEHMEDKTSVVDSDTLKLRLHEATNAPPAFVLLMGPAQQMGKQWAISKEESTIGRTLEADIFVDDRSVSRRHAKLIFREGEVFIKDINSANGTEVEGQRIEPEVLVVLKNNQQVKTGNVIFKYLAEGNLEIVSNRDRYDKSRLDPLTQIFNKGALLSTGEEVFKRAKTMGVALTVVVFDLDNFKFLNDTWGHQAGDIVLKEMSALIKRKVIRGEDFFARFGGEEFCLVLLGSDQRQGVEIGERIRSTVEKFDFEYRGEKMPVTISVGVASLDPSMTSWSQLFDKSDQASYLSKKNGKNRVSTL